MNEPVWIAVPSLNPDDVEGLVPWLRNQRMQLRFHHTSANTPEDDVIEQLQGCRLVIAGGELYTQRVFAAAPQLEHMARFGVGFDAVDLDAATRHGVAVTNTPGTLDNSVADHTFALMLALARHIASLDRQVRAGVWQSTLDADVWGATLGIIGLGRIGQAVARRARGFNMRILAHEVQPDEAFVADRSVELAPLDQLLQESDFVTLHTPITEDTAGLIDARALALMKPSAYLINTARGGLVDEAALYDALTGGNLAGAGLDTRAAEPPTDPRLAQLDNVVSTPHCGARSPRAWLTTCRHVAQNITDVMECRRPNTLLNPDVWDRYLEKVGSQS